MKIEIEIDEKELVKNITESLPEAACCLCCTKWDYKRGIFTFVDEEDGKEYVITTDQIIDKLPQFIRKCVAGKYHFFGDLSYVADATNWDGWAVDGLVQETIFDEVIYG